MGIDLETIFDISPVEELSKEAKAKEKTKLEEKNKNEIKDQVMGLKKSIKNLKVGIGVLCITSVQLYTMSVIYLKNAIERNEIPQLTNSPEPVICFAAGTLLVGAGICKMNVTNKKEKLEDIYNESPELRPTKKPKRLMR